MGTGGATTSPVRLSTVVAGLVLATTLTVFSWSPLRPSLLKETVISPPSPGRSGFFGQWGAQLNAGFHMGQRYLAIAPEQILAETPGNLALAPGQVSAIRVEDRSRPSGDDDSTDYVRIAISTPGGQGVYETNGTNPSSDQVRELLGRIFGPIVR